MRLLYDDDLVEAVVTSSATGVLGSVNSMQIRRFHAERERCYATHDPDERAAGFARMHLSWFVEWGYAERLTRLADPFPQLNGALRALAFRKGRGKNDEGAELYCDEEGNRRGIVALHPDRCGDEFKLTCFVHHELAHLADMVDPQFEYVPDLGLAGATLSQQRLVRERYRLLWDVSLDGRLTQRNLPTIADKARRRAEFDRGFIFMEEPRREELFTALWSGHMARHADLLRVATDPRELQEQQSAIPGAPCPLCGFAAFDWTAVSTLRLPAQERIRAECPGWQENEAVCARCAEMYDAIVGQEYPSTVCL